MPKLQANRLPPVCRVLLADNQAIFRAGTARVLAAKPEIDIVGQCSDLHLLPSLIATADANVLLLALSMGADLEATAAAAESTDTRILLMTEDGSVPAALAPRSIYGKLTRQTSAEELLTCVRRVHEGERILASTKSVENVGERIRDALSARELQIVGLVVQGCKNRRIAEELGTSEQVVKNSLRAIYDKTGSSDPLELALLTLHHRSLAEAAARAIDGHEPPQA